MNGKIVDPVCDMVVDIDDARDAGLMLEHPDTERATAEAPPADAGIYETAESG